MAEQAKAAGRATRAASQDHDRSPDHSHTSEDAQRNDVEALPRPEPLPQPFCGSPHAEDPEVPPQFTSWPRFVTWAVCCGHAPPERLSELVVREIREAE